MPESAITSLDAFEILDSRSRPTLKVRIGLADGTRAEAQVPSGASTGAREAVELRDEDPNRFDGKGVQIAVNHVNQDIAERIIGTAFDSVACLDRALIELDDTPNKSRLGANAILGVSMAFARACAQSKGMELFEFLPTITGQAPHMPIPCFNVLNGGVHAANPLDFQEFMICPLGANSMSEAVRTGSEIYAALRARLAKAGHPVGLGDEGGFAPSLAEPEEALDVIVAAIADAGYEASINGVAIAIDPASSEFRNESGEYVVNGKHLTSEEMIARYEAIIDKYPVWLLEDGLAEDDWEGWAKLTERLGNRVELVGDDIFCTNPMIIRKGIESKVANASLIKLNQIGTVTETLRAMSICAEFGYRQFMSHRSGETPDTFIADLAVATGCGHIKTGAPARGERIAKYNRLVEISHDHPELAYGLEV